MKKQSSICSEQKTTGINKQKEYTQKRVLQNQLQHFKRGKYENTNISANIEILREEPEQIREITGELIREKSFSLNKTNIINQSKGKHKN